MKDLPNLIGKRSETFGSRLFRDFHLRESDSCGWIRVKSLNEGKGSFVSFKMAGKFNGCFDVNNASLQLNNTDNSFFFCFFYSATVTPPKRRIMFLINNVGR